MSFYTTWTTVSPNMAFMEEASIGGQVYEYHIVMHFIQEHKENAPVVDAGNTQQQRKEAISAMALYFYRDEPTGAALAAAMSEIEEKSVYEVRGHIVQYKKMYSLTKNTVESWTEKIPDQAKMQKSISMAVEEFQLKSLYVQDKLEEQKDGISIAPVTKRMKKFLLGLRVVDKLFWDQIQEVARINKYPSLLTPTDKVEFVFDDEDNIVTMIVYSPTTGAHRCNAGLDYMAKRPPMNNPLTRAYYRNLNEIEAVLDSTMNTSDLIKLFSTLLPPSERNAVLDVLPAVSTGMGLAAEFYRNRKKYSRIARSAASNLIPSLQVKVDMALQNLSVENPTGDMNAKEFFEHVTTSLQETYGFVGKMPIREILKRALAIMAPCVPLDKFQGSVCKIFGNAVDYALVKSEMLYKFVKPEDRRDTENRIESRIRNTDPDNFNTEDGQIVLDEVILEKLREGGCLSEEERNTIKKDTLYDEIRKYINAPNLEFVCKLLLALFAALSRLPKIGDFDEEALEFPDFDFPKFSWPIIPTIDPKSIVMRDFQDVFLLQVEMLIKQLVQLAINAFANQICKDGHKNNRGNEHPKPNEFKSAAIDLSEDGFVPDDFRRNNDAANTASTLAPYIQRLFDELLSMLTRDEACRLFSGSPYPSTLILVHNLIEQNYPNLASKTQTDDELMQIIEIIADNVTWDIYCQPVQDPTKIIESLCTLESSNNSGTIDDSSMAVVEGVISGIVGTDDIAVPINCDTMPQLNKVHPSVEFALRGTYNQFFTSLVSTFNTELDSVITKLVAPDLNVALNQWQKAQDADKPTDGGTPSYGQQFDEDVYSTKVLPDVQMAMDEFNDIVRTDNAHLSLKIDGVLRAALEFLPMSTFDGEEKDGVLYEALSLTTPEETPLTETSPIVYSLSDISKFITDNGVIKSNNGNVSIRTHLFRTLVQKMFQVPKYSMPSSYGLIAANHAGWLLDLSSRVALEMMQRIRTSPLFDSKELSSIDLTPPMVKCENPRQYFDADRYVQMAIDRNDELRCKTCEAGKSNLVPDDIQNALFQTTVASIVRFVCLNEYFYNIFYNARHDMLNDDAAAQMLFDDVEKALENYAVYSVGTANRAEERKEVEKAVLNLAKTGATYEAALKSIIRDEIASINVASDEIIPPHLRIAEPEVELFDVVEESRIPDMYVYELADLGATFELCKQYYVRFEFKDGFVPTKKAHGQYMMDLFDGKIIKGKLISIEKFLDIIATLASEPAMQSKLHLLYQVFFKPFRVGCRVLMKFGSDMNAVKPLSGALQLIKDEKVLWAYQFIANATLPPGVTKDTINMLLGQSSYHDYMSGIGYTEAVELWPIIDDVVEYIIPQAPLKSVNQDGAEYGIFRFVGNEDTLKFLLRANVLESEKYKVLASCIRPSEFTRLASVFITERIKLLFEDGLFPESENTLKHMYFDALVGDEYGANEKDTNEIIAQRLADQQNANPVMVGGPPRRKKRSSYESSMALKTPVLILKGIAEMTDPAVKLGNTIINALKLPETSLPMVCAPMFWFPGITPFGYAYLASSFLLANLDDARKDSKDRGDLELDKQQMLDAEKQQAECAEKQEKT